MRKLITLGVLMLLLASCSLFQKPHTVAPEVSYVDTYLPYGATDVVKIDDAKQYGDTWYYFTLDGKRFLMGIHDLTSSRFSTCITQIKE